MYLAVIGDLIASNESPRTERYAVQERLEHVLYEINQKYHREIASQFLITLGNEFQGLLKKPDHLFDICESIIMALKDQPVRFGLGCGDIYTKIKELSIGADGPAYHHAREALEFIIHQRERHESIPMMWHYISNQRSQELIANILAHMSFQRQKWTLRQTQIIQEMMHTESQKGTAHKFSVTQPYINKVLKNNGYYLYLSSRRIVTESIRRDMRV